MALQWRPDTDRPSSLLGTPSAKRYLAALIAHEPDQPPIGVHALPEENEFEYLPVSGGFAILHDRGVLLFDDWRAERLRLGKLIEELQRVFDLLGMVCLTRADLDTLSQELSAKTRRPAPALLGDMATLRARLTPAEQRLQPASHWEDVRRFRKALERRWGLEGALPELHKRVVQFEEAVRTDSTLRTQRLVSIIASYGLPFYISSAVTGFLAPVIDRSPYQWLGFDPAAVKVSIYVALALSLVAAIKLANRWLLGRHKGQRRVSDTQKEKT